MSERFTDFIVGTCLGGLIAGSLLYMLGFPLWDMALSFLISTGISFVVYKLRGNNA